MIEFIDRVQKDANKIRLLPVEGEENTYYYVRAGELLEAGTPVNRAALMALQGFTAQTTEFSSDGTVTQTNSLGHTLVTSFGSGCITQTFTADKTITKTITPGENNSITEEIS